MKHFFLIFLLSPIILSCQTTDKHRQEISLNGTWEIAKTDLMNKLPSAFASKIPVPGLVDMAEPDIDDQDSAYNNSIYWCKRTFTVEDLKADVIPPTSKS